MKKILALAFFAFATSLCLAQQALPNDPEVRTGKLKNGMTYFIRHNALPEGRCDFYLATDAGAIQEAPDQDGLAHFLEHMCFNGLKNLPGKQMLDYLLHIGAEFGRNINVVTGVEQTQYMLIDMPVTREGILDTCLLVMHDFSHFVLNEQEEIDAERGVILEEKRARSNASWRMFEKSAPYLYGESSKYAQCNIIGSEENIKNFKRESIVNFYETWHRPDLQALIVVGDIDVDQVYNKIVKLFADIPAPVNPKKKVMPAVEINDEPVAGIITDPENTSTSVEFIWKLGEPSPKAFAGTDAGYLERFLNKLISGVMRERLDDITSKADAPFLSASLDVGNLCKTCNVLMGNISCENSKALDAVEAFLVQVEKVKRYGFTDPELDRVKEDLVNYYKTRAARAGTRKNSELVRPIINHFFSGVSYLTPEFELQLVESLCAQINAAVVNQILPQLFTGEHLTIIYTGVDKPDQVHPTAQQILACVDAASKAEIAAPVAEQINKDFMQGIALKAGEVVKETTGDYGSIVWTLSNGLKVIVKPTEFKKDQVLFSLEKKGGLTMVPTGDIASFNSDITSIFNNNCGIASYPCSTVSKMLAGKSVSVSPYIGADENGINGKCAPEDFETALQLMYLYFAAPRFDQDEWDVGINQISSVLPNYVSNPSFAFQKHLYSSVFSSPRQQMISEETLKKANLEAYAKNYKAMFADIAGATLYIVGNVDPSTIKPLVEKYAGALAKGKKAAVVNEKNVPKFVKGQIKDEFTAMMTTPEVRVLQFYSADVPYSVQKFVDLNAAAFILDMIYAGTLREEEGGTYGASLSIELQHDPIERALIQVVFGTNEAQQAKLRELAISGLKGLAEEGPTEEELTRAIKNAKKNLPEQRISNSYWLNAFSHNACLGIDYDAELEKAIGNISADGIKSVLSEILAAGNFIEIVMFPEK